MRAFLGIVLTVLLTSLATQPALADKRVALVLGTAAADAFGGRPRPVSPQAQPAQPSAEPEAAGAKADAPKPATAEAA